MAKTILLAFVLAAFELSAHDNSRSNTGNVNSYSAGSKEDLSRLAGQMLDDTNSARVALKKGDHKAAIQDVKRAENDLEKVEARAHGTTMIPVYQEFVSVSILGPVRAEHNARKTAGKQVTAEVSNSNAAVQGVAGEYTRVEVSTTVAKNGLGAAEAALNKGDWKTADAALSDVQDGVQIESVESDMPLSRARENLILARAAVRGNHYTEAKASLEAASAALSKYASQGTPHASEAKNLQRQVDALSHNIQQDHANAVEKINNWWNTLSGWSPYQSEQESARR